MGCDFIYLLFLQLKTIANLLSKKHLANQNSPEKVYGSLKNSPEKM